MDSLTQIVLGAAVGEAVAGKKMGAKAALLGAIAGTVPDLDVVVRFLSHPIDGALMHRGFSHSIVFACIAGPLLGAIFHHFSKKRYTRVVYMKIFFFSILTHPLLDVFTNYGTELFWPFSTRITFNAVFVVDPLYTLPFLICVLIALLLKKSHKWRSKINWIGINYSILYLTWCIIVKVSVLHNASNYFQNAGVHVQEDRILVAPMPLTSFYWMLLGEDSQNFYVCYKSIFGEFEPDKLEIIPKRHELLESLNWKGKNYTKQLQLISNNYYSMERVADTVLFYDLRFGTSCALTNWESCTPIMGCGMVVDNGIVQKTTGIRGGRSKERINFDAYINEVLGND